MTPIRNIHKGLVIVLFTVGVGLLLMGAQAGHRVLASAAGWGVNEKSGLDSDIALSGGKRYMPLSRGSFPGVS